MDFSEGKFEFDPNGSLLRQYHDVSKTYNLTPGELNSLERELKLYTDTGLLS